MISGPLIRFLLVGVANTLVGLSAIWVIKELMGTNDITANVAGYAIGLTVSFFLNKRWTFGFRGGAARSLLRFLAVFAVSYSANLVTVVSLVKVTGSAAFWCQACGVIPYSTLFYLGCRCYAFPPGSLKSHDAHSLAG